MSRTLTKTAAEIIAYEEQLRSLDEDAIYDVRALLDPDGVDAGYFSEDEALYYAWVESEHGAYFRDQLGYAITRLGGAPVDPGEER